MTSKAQPKRIPGEAGVWVLVFSDLMVFTVLFVTFAWNRGQNAAGFSLPARTKP